MEILWKKFIDKNKLSLWKMECFVIKGMAKFK